MKILHLADLHLGKIVLGLPMIEDQRFILNQALNLCKTNNIHHIIISGDVYDRSIPPEDAVTLLNDFLSKVVLEEKIKVFVISGNHDSRDRLSCFNALLEKAGLIIDGLIKDDLTMNKHILEEDGLKVNLYSLPYVFPADVRALTKDDNIKSFESAVNKVLEANKLDENEINVINTHYFVTGDKEPIRSDSEARQSVGTIEQISYTIFDHFDYVALGHLHCPQHIGREHVRYAGSPLRYSQNEINQKKVFTIVNIKAKNDITITQVDVKPLHDFINLEGSVDDLTKDSEIKDERIVYFKLTDASPVLNAAARLKVKYPNYVGLEYINIKSKFTPEEGKLTKADGFDTLPIDEQFQKFSSFLQDIELDDYQKQALKDVAEEITKEDN